MSHATAIEPPGGRPAPPVARHARADRHLPDRSGPPAGAGTTAETEFHRAMREYKLASGRNFPTWSEVLEVLRGLGYQKPARPE